jgi:hypothetical protein
MARQLTSRVVFPTSTVVTSQVTSRSGSGRASGCSWRGTTLGQMLGWRLGAHPPSSLSWRCLPSPNHNSRGSHGLVGVQTVTLAAAPNWIGSQLSWNRPWPKHLSGVGSRSAVQWLAWQMGTQGAPPEVDVALGWVMGCDVDVAGGMLTHLGGSGSAVSVRLWVALGWGWAPHSCSCFPTSTCCRWPYVPDFTIQPCRRGLPFLVPGWFFFALGWLG